MSSNDSGYNTPSNVPTIDPTADKRPYTLKVDNGNTFYTDDHIFAKYEHKTSTVDVSADGYVVRPAAETFEFRTDRKVAKTGLMLVGWGGNNGTTLSAIILANKHNISWQTKRGLQLPNYIGSLLRASTTLIGTSPQSTLAQNEVYLPMSDLVPMLHPNDIVLGGWDISGLEMDKAMERAQVLDYDLQRQLKPFMNQLGKPLPSIYYPDFIAANQSDRADNLLPGQDKQAHLDQIRADIKKFKQENELDSVIVFWTANTERYSSIIPGVNDTPENILAAIRSSHPEVSPSSLFAVAAILEGCPFINGAPQNTFVPALLTLASSVPNSFIAGDDLKSGQTKMKSVLAEYLVGAGIKPLAISSYNHLGNNDGRNLSAQEQFRSKEISKRGVVDDMVESNELLFPTGSKSDGESKDSKHAGPDHVIVIKYIPSVGDSKRAIDEYYSEICCGGRSVINIFNECEDSLLATPLILDLTILAELITRVRYRRISKDGAKEEEWQYLPPLTPLLSYMLKAPLPPSDKGDKDQTVINSLGRQRSAVENFLRALVGIEVGGGNGGWWVNGL